MKPASLPFELRIWSAPPALREFGRLGCANRRSFSGMVGRGSTAAFSCLSPETVSDVSSWRPADAGRVGFSSFAGIALACCWSLASCFGTG